MKTALVTYSQTATERYDTDVNERARKALEGLGLTVLAVEGGCEVGPDAPPLPAENAIKVQGSEEQVAKINDALRFILGSPETLQVEQAETTEVVRHYDHPAVIIEADLKPEFHEAARYLRGHEAEHNVTFATLDNDALAAVRETYDNLHPQMEPRDTLHATEEFARAVRDLLGLDD